VGHAVSDADTGEDKMEVAAARERRSVLEIAELSIALLGPHFDIHTGGIDHRELHHVNEIAQSEAFLADGLPWVRYWLHNEFLQLSGTKMAKSAGGAPRLADLTAAGYHPAAFRLFLLGGHYRSQLDFTTPKLLAALQDALRDPEITPDGLRTVTAAADALLGLGLATLDPADLNRRRSAADLNRRRSAADLTAAERQAIDQLVAARTQARQNRDWPRADQLRAELDALGVDLTDTPEGPIWQLR
jgi:cysteinyl-tRNA synthetase